ncbi:hypothetical protein [Dickeya zeae]|uniref:hypothetical protein n=1 Tax=Dickeya zeae TaxID=204042 RepID=UPI00035C4148|nr:hypothetical protein [Dickeya zeae]PLY35752.1 hypothetical protein F164LOC_18800 [Pectobacterium carotovorum]UJR55057.1 hypothetical protein J417_14005 [Dickeya zeae MS1]
MSKVIDIMFSEHPKSGIFFLLIIVLILTLWCWNKKHPNRKGDNDAIKKPLVFFLVISGLIYFTKVVISVVDYSKSKNQVIDVQYNSIK